MRGLLQSAQIDVEERVPVHHEETGIERLARHRQRAGCAERRLFPQHADPGVADPAPIVSRLENLPEIAREQDDVLISVTFDHLEKVVEERPLARDWQHGLRDGLGDRAEASALAARQDHRLPDRPAPHRLSAVCASRLCCFPHTRSASAAARKT